MASEIKSITSEQLEAAYRALTPSQSGFTQDLQASNTIIPILDLTSSATGESTPQYLQTALAFGSQTAFDLISATGTIASNPGFYRIVAGLSVQAGGGTAQEITFRLTDGSTNKEFYRYGSFGSGGSGVMSTNVDLTVFLTTGESLLVIADAQCRASGSIRQVADSNGTLVNPSGFTPQ